MLTSSTILDVAVSIQTCMYRQRPGTYTASVRDCHPILKSKGLHIYQKSSTLRPDGPWCAVRLLCAGLMLDSRLTWRPQSSGAFCHRSVRSFGNPSPLSSHLLTSCASHMLRNASSHRGTSAQMNHCALQWQMHSRKDGMFLSMYELPQTVRILKAIVSSDGQLSRLDGLSGGNTKALV